MGIGMKRLVTSLVVASFSLAIFGLILFGSNYSLLEMTLQENEPAKGIESLSKDFILE